MRIQKRDLEIRLIALFRPEAPEMGAKTAFIRPPRRIMRTIFLGILLVTVNIVIFRHGITMHGAQPLLTLVSFLFWWSLYANLKRPLNVLITRARSRKKRS